MSFNDFLNKYGDQTTSNIQLIEWAKELNIPLKYAMRDELLKLPKSTRYIIMNLDDSKGEGTHHIAIYNTPTYKFYFSSYGDSPVKEAVEFFKKFSTSKTICEYSDTQYQDFNSHYCGQISLYVLYKIHNRYKLQDILLSFKL